MDMTTLLKHFLITLVVFLAIDMLWLGVLARGLYQNQLGFLMKEKVNWTAAIIFYMIFVAGLMFFVQQPALARDSLRYALGAGALFGLVTYATYDLTSLSVTRDWPVLITVVDLIWGTLLSAGTSGISFWIIRNVL